jgi:hypothetical protein
MPAMTSNAAAAVKSLVSALSLHGGAGLRITATPRPGDGYELELTPSAAPGPNERVVRGTIEIEAGSRSELTPGGRDTSGEQLPGPGAGLRSAPQRLGNNEDGAHGIHWQDRRGGAGD